MKKSLLLMTLFACATALFAQSNTLVVPLGGNTTMEFIRVPAGTFQMGSPEGEALRRDNESYHAVTLTKAFWLGKYEVTQAQWSAVMCENPSKHLGNGAFPVECVSWEDAMLFCVKLTEQERKAGRLAKNEAYILPTEAQWEYACRAGSTTPFAFGNTLDASQANFDGNHAYGKTNQAAKFLNTTAPVGSYKPNAWGFYDMHGNVMEWCLDFYKENLGTAAIQDPFFATETPYHVYRGGNFRDIGAFCRSAFRYFNLPHFRYNYLGFRVARVTQP